MIATVSSDTRHRHVDRQPILLALILEKTLRDRLFGTAYLLPLALAMFLTACDGSSGNSSGEPEPEATILNEDNANAIIMQAFEVYTGRAYDRRHTAYPYVKRAPSLTPATNSLAGHFYYETLACSNSGEKSENVYDTGAGFDVFRFYDTTYTDCSIGSDTLNGRAVLSGDLCCFKDYKQEFSNNFSVAFGNDGRMELSGIYNSNGNTENFYYHFSYSGGTLTITNATTTGLSGSFGMTPPILEGDSVEVSVEQAFENDESPTTLAFSQGSMRITAADSEIFLDANNGDPETVNLSITAEGETTTLIEPWSNWFHALSFERPIMGQDLVIAQPDGDGKVLNQGTYKAILSDVFKVMTGERFGATILDLPGYPYPEVPAELASITGFGPEHNETCDNGGTAQSWPFRWGYREVTSGWQSEFADCIRENKTYNGNISTRTYFTTHFSNGLTVSQENNSTTFKGVLRYKTWPYYADSPWPTYYYELTNAYLDSTSSTDPYVLGAANLIFSTNNNREAEGSSSIMKGRFTLSSQATMQNTISVLTARELSFEHTDSTDGASDARSDNGILYINAGNGNELYLHAATGDSDTFNITIYQPGQSAVTITEQWQDWQSLLLFNYDLRG